ncbi:MAG: prolipoprotein diacylglyceryl transferase family protein, partial [Bacteroidales bacterium]|nr:prolipoprotein diacylglyceryl transferase family protein [Bacteroidales bacterium]
MNLATVIWNMDPVAFSIGSLELRWYSLLFVTAFIAGYVILNKVVFEKEKVPTNYLDTLAFYVFLGVLIGARLGHCLFYEASYYLSNPIEMFLPIKITDDGWRFIG